MFKRMTKRFCFEPYVTKAVKDLVITTSLSYKKMYVAIQYNSTHILKPDSENYQKDRISVLEIAYNKHFAAIFLTNGNFKFVEIVYLVRI